MLVVEVMNMFGNVKLKSQKLNLTTLMSNPEFKQQYLPPIRSLDDDQCTLPTQVIKGECSLSELTVQAAEL